MRSQRARGAPSALAFLLLAVACVQEAETQVVTPGPPKGYFSLVDKFQVCPTSLGPDALLGIPRMNRLFKSTSNDIGAWELFDCKGDTAFGNKTCSIKEDIGVLGEFQPGTISEYLEGIIVYSVFNVAIIAAYLGFVLLQTFMRYCTGCAGGPNDCATLRCGAAWPTRRVRFCGFKYLPDGRLAYTSTEKFCNRLLMLVFTIFLFSCILVAEFRGNKAMTENSATFLDALDGFTSLGTSAVPPVESFAYSVGREIIVPLMDTLNTTLYTNIDFNTTLHDFLCANYTVSNLPNVTASITSVRNLQGAVADASAYASIMFNGTADVEVQRAAVRNETAVLDGWLKALDNTTTTWASTYTRGRSAINVVNSRRFELVDPFAGLAQYTVGMVQAIQREPAPGAGVPTAAFLYNSTGRTWWDYATMTRLWWGNMTGKPTEIRELVNKLNHTFVLVSSTPDFAASAQAVRNLTSRIQTIRVDLRTLTEMTAAMRQVESVARGVPSRNAVLASIARFNATANSVNFTTISNNALQLAAYIRAIPRLDEFLGSLDIIQSVPALLPCLQRLGDQLTHVNQTLIQLPYVVDAVAQMYDAVHSSIDATVRKGREIQWRAAAAQGGMNAFAAPLYVAQLANLRANITAAQSAFFNVSSVTNLLGTLDTALTFNFTASGVYSQLQAWDAALTRLNVSEDLLLAMEAVEPTKQTMLRFLREFVTEEADVFSNEQLLFLPVGGRLRQLAMGYCFGDAAPQRSCNVDADCGRTPTLDPTYCTANGMPRCSFHQSEYCESDAICVEKKAGDPDVRQSVCLWPRSLIRGANASVAVVAQPDYLPDVTPILRNITFMIGAGPSLDLVAPQQQLQTINTAVLAMRSPITPHRKALERMMNGTTAAVFNSTVVNAVVSALQQQAAAIPFNEFYPLILTLRNTIADLKVNKAPLIKDAFAMFKAFLDLFSYEWEALMERMTPASLRAMRAAYGPATMMLEFPAVLQDINNYLKENQWVLNFPTIDVLDTANLVLSFLDKAAGYGHYADNLKHGAPYYFGQLLIEGRMVRSDEAAAKLITVDADGALYGPSTIYRPIASVRPSPSSSPSYAPTVTPGINATATYTPWANVQLGFRRAEGDDDSSAGTDDDGAAPAVSPGPAAPALAAAAAPARRLRLGAAPVEASDARAPRAAVGASAFPSASSSPSTSPSPSLSPKPVTQVEGPRGNIGLAGPRLCLTRDCLQASTDMFNTQPLSELETFHPSKLLSVPTSLSRQGMFTILLMLPLALMLLAGCSICAHLCFIKPKWQKMPVEITMWCFLLQIPVALIVSSVGWPASMVVADVCASAPNIGFNWLLSAGNSTCLRAGGAGGLYNCTFSGMVPVLDMPIQAMVPMVQEYQVLTSSAGCPKPDKDPMRGALTFVQKQVRNMTRTRFRSAFASDTVTRIATLRDPLAGIFINATERFGALVETLLQKEYDAVFACGKLRPVVETTRNAFCCAFAPPLYWYFSSWYLMAWAMLCCGLPAAILGRKRFPIGLYGPAYQELIDNPYELVLKKMQAENGLIPEETPTKKARMGTAMKALGKSIGLKKGQVVALEEDEDGNPIVRQPAKQKDKVVTVPDGLLDTEADGSSGGKSPKKKKAKVTPGGP